MGKAPLFHLPRHQITIFDCLVFVWEGSNVFFSPNLFIICPFRGDLVRRVRWCELSILSFCVQTLSSSLYLFSDGWEDRWVIANNSEKTLGNLTVEAPKKCMNRERSKSLKTTTESSYYAISADIGRTISTVNKTFIFAYMVKCEQEDLRVGGAYLKLFSENIDQTRLNGSTPYYFMFGWDLERGHPQRVQALLRVKGKEYNHSPPLKLEKDSRTHLFTFIMRPDYTYEIRLDNNKTQAGNMWESWYGYMEPPKFLDPDARKPADWVDEMLRFMRSES